MPEFQQELDSKTFNNSNNRSYEVASSSMLILNEQSQQREQKHDKNCEMEELFSGPNHFFRDDEILKESEHSSALVRKYR